MEVRGRRRCKACGTEWSYFETGSTSCPECGSMLSVGVGERKTQTDHAPELDLESAVAALADDDLRRAAESAEESARAYLRQRGFIRGGELLDLDDTYLAACELRFAAGTLARRTDVEESAEAYFRALVSRVGEGRPDVGDVPASLRDARGLGYANAVRDYRQELREWTDAPSQELRDVVETLGEHVKRVRALDGDVPPEDVEALVAAARAAADAARAGSEESSDVEAEALERAREYLDSIE